MGPTAREPDLPAPLLGEWACLGVVYDQPAHGWAVAARLRPDGDIGRVWHLSRPLTYRSLDQLGRRRWIRAVGEEPGDAAPNRTLLAATRVGRSRLRAWVATPVPHLRDLRSELLLKLVLADVHGIEHSAMLDEQRSVVDEHVAALRTSSKRHPDDVVVQWRLEVARAAQRFLRRIRPNG